ncbi:hypothetical protein GCM10029992_52700 [Glycomyces albus]
MTGTVRSELAFAPRPPAGPGPESTPASTNCSNGSASTGWPRPTRTLSGGEARRLSVAGALAAAPGVLMLDEPTFGQDRRTWGELVDLTANIRDEGTAVLAVTHDRDFAAALADRELALRRGEVDREVDRC